MEHRLENPVPFMKAGNALFTVENSLTGNRFTFHVTKLDDPTKEIYFVSVLTGQNNETDYTYLGTIFGDQFRKTRNSRISEGAISFRAFDWFNRHAGNLPESVHVYHEGKCGRCGRTLTVPESVTNGFGPECLLKLAA